MMQLQSLPPPPHPPQLPPCPPQQLKSRIMMMIQVQEHPLPPSLQEHPPPQFVADKSLILGSS